MKVSIMLTSYNLVDYIDTSIRSVVNMEKPFDWELLIGDDGSTDRTVEKIKIWVDKFPDNIKLFQIDRSKEVDKLGSRAAKNRAMLLEKATGDYLNYLDGDDEFVGVDKLRKQVELLEMPEFSGCSCCAHNIIANYIQKGEQSPLMRTDVPMRIYSIKQYWPKMYFHTNTIMFRKECKSLMLDTLYRDHLNDTFITYCLLQFGNILYIPDVYAKYNLTGQGLWTGKGKVYSCFRNMMIYDLELRINPLLSKESFVHHLYHFNVIRKNYTREGQDGVCKLLSDVDTSVYKYSTLLYKITGLSSAEVTNKRRLFRRAQLMTTCLRVKRLIKKIFRCH